MKNFAFVVYDFSQVQEENLCHLAEKCNFDFRISYHASHDSLTREHWHIYIFCLPDFDFDLFLRGYNEIFRVPLVKYNVSFSSWSEQILFGGCSFGHF